MKQDNRFEATKKATEAPLEFTNSVLESTHSVIEQSKKLRTPSPKVAKIGTTIGGCVGGGLLLTGAIQLFTGKPLWALGTASAGVATIISNYFTYQKSKKSSCRKKSNRPQSG